jgi:hypothetical protein
VLESGGQVDAVEYSITAKSKKSYHPVLLAIINEKRHYKRKLYISEKAGEPWNISWKIIQNNSQKNTLDLIHGQ